VKALVLIAAATLVIVSTPLPLTVAPDWTIITLDAGHKPLFGITVREVWQQYSIENSSHEEDRLTDTKGEVHFPRRTYRASFAHRFLGCASEISTTGVHASSGAHLYLVAFGKGVDTMDWTDLSQEYGMAVPWQRSTLVLKH
jgi:hypothetical protein